MGCVVSFSLILYFSSIYRGDGPDKAVVLPNFPVRGLLLQRQHWQLWSESNLYHSGWWMVFFDFLNPFGIKEVLLLLLTNLEV